MKDYTMSQYANANDLRADMLEDIKRLIAEVEDLNKGCRLLEQTIKNQKDTYVGSKKYWETTNKRLRDALEDMLAGWRYARATHGDLYGVGWDRAQNKAEQAIEGEGDDVS